MMPLFVHYYVTNAINFLQLHDVTPGYDNSYNQFLMIITLPTYNTKGKTSHV